MFNCFNKIKLYFEPIHQQTTIWSDEKWKIVIHIQCVSLCKILSHFDEYFIVELDVLQ